MLNVSDSPLFSRGLDSELAQGDEPSDEVFNLQCQVNFLTEQLAEARGGSLATDVHKELSHARQLLVSRDGDIAQYEAQMLALEAENNEARAQLARTQAAEEQSRAEAERERASAEEARARGGRE